MSKALKNSNLPRHGATHALVAVSLSFTLVAFGCTTDRTLGNGDPVMTPGLRSNPTGGTSTGTESAPTVPDSMTSSSSIGSDRALPLVTVRNGLSRADQAAALMAQHQPRERYLGPAFPGPAGRPYASEGLRTGQFQNPAMRTNPQLTVNSSLTSGPTEVISSGAGETGVAGDTAVLSAAVIGSTDATGVVATGTTSVGTTAAAPLFSTGTTGLSTTATTSLPTGTLAASATPTTSPTAFSVIAPSPLAATAPRTVTTAAAGSDINGTLVAGTTSNGTTANVTSGATARVTSGSATAAAAIVSPNAVRITTDSSGRRVITNVNATASRNQ